MRKYISIIIIGLMLSMCFIVNPVSSDNTITITSDNQSINITTISEEKFQKKDETTRFDENSTFEATGFYYVKEVDGVWWYINSTGEKFFSVGITGVEPSPLFYGNVLTWANETVKNLTKWGFNTLRGAALDLFPNRVSTIKRFSFKKLDDIYLVRWMNPRFPDVFDPVWREAVRDIINEGVEEYKNDSNLLGYELGNELKLGPDNKDERTLLEVYMAAGNNTHGKQRLIKFFRERYNEIDDFNKVWNMEITSFDDLNDTIELGIKGAWRFRSNITSYRRKLINEYPSLKNDELFDKAKDDVVSFCRLATHCYFNVTNTYLKAADPNHLNLGVRFHLLGVPREVLEECSKDVDVISINYYRGSMMVYDPSVRFLCNRYGYVSLDNWMLKYYEISGRPLRVCEYSFSNNDGSWPMKPDDIIKPTISHTQERRADIFEWYVTNCQKSPYLVGQGCWFLYRDVYNVNWGLVDFWDQPYESLVNRMTTVNKKAIEVHENASYDKIVVEKPYDTILSNVVSPYFYNNLNRLFTPYYSFGENEIPYPDICSSWNARIAYPIQSIGKDSKTIYVDNDSFCPGDGSINWPYYKIQYAIENASHGDTIIVLQGTYSEQIIIDKSLTLMGQGDKTTVIDGGIRGVAVEVVADNVNIAGFNITSLSGSYYLKDEDYRASSGISIYKCNDTKITNNVFYYPGGWGGGWGIMALKSDNTMISNNTFNGTYSMRDCGIIIDSSNDAVIADNHFTNHGLTGIWISSCKNSTIKNNTIESGKTFGILIWGAQNNTIIGNTLRGIKQKGICLKNSKNNNIIENNFIKEKTLIKGDIVDQIEDIYYKINYRSAAFFYSRDNTWKGNYWGRPYLRPKLICGRTGTNGLILAVNFDWHPALYPYAI